LNKVIRFVGKIKLKATNSSTANNQTFQLVRYPLRPLLGELGFIGLRGTGFLLTMLLLNL
jgi:hypothetical protein